MKLILKLAVFVLLTRQYAMADWGDRFLRVQCDPEAGVFMVEPLMIWNEAYDEIAPMIKKNQGRLRIGGIDYFGMEWFGESTETCKMHSDYIELFIPRYDYSFKLFQNGALVSHINVGAVWQMSGFVYKVRFKNGAGWQEYCGLEDAENVWKPFKSSERNTDDCWRNANRT